MPHCRFSTTYPRPLRGTIQCRLPGHGHGTEPTSGEEEKFGAFGKELCSHEKATLKVFTSYHIHAPHKEASFPVSVCTFDCINIAAMDKLCTYYAHLRGLCYHASRCSTVRY